MGKALFIALLFFVSGCGQFMDEEITVYPVICNGTQKKEIDFFDVLNGKACDGNLLELNRTVYRVSRTRQEVIYWLPGINDIPSRLTDCAVKNAKNFRCDYEDKSGGIIMSNGKPIEHGSDYFYVSWWEWYWLRLYGYLGPVKHMINPIIIIASIISVGVLIMALLKDYKEKRAEKKRAK